MEPILSPIENDIEYRTPEEIKCFQEGLLQEALHYLSEHSAYYRRMFERYGIRLDRIRHLEDRVKIPFTEKKDLQLFNEEFLCCPRERIVDYVTTSGTLGDPVTFGCTERDLQRLAYNEKKSFACAGLRPGNIVQLMTTLDKRFMAGLAYIPLLLLPATYLSTTKLIFVLAAVAVSDTSAYFVGTRFGHHKLWPRVSPNKSSEGAVGSLVGCVIFCTIYGACLGSASWWAFALLGIAINAFAQLGDLFESALKRAVHVKDSSNLLPGHGGILDRADSILFAMPMFAVVDQWFFFF